MKHSSFGTCFAANLLVTLIVAAFCCLSVWVSGIGAIALGIYSVILWRSIPLEGDAARALLALMGALALACTGVLLLHFEQVTLTIISFIAAICVSAYFNYVVYGKKK